MALPTAADMDQIRAASNKLAMDAPGLVGYDAFFSIVALSLATAHAAVLTGMEFEDLFTLLKLHYEHTQLTKVAQDVERAGQVVTVQSRSRGEPS